MNLVKRYIAYFLSIYFILFGLALSVNYLVDPYRIYWSDVTQRWDTKPKAQAQIFFNKAAGIRENRPKTILLGNSRVQWGMHASSANWPGNMRPIYNAGIPGSNIATALDYLEYTLDLGKVNTVVLGLDYFSFLIPEDTDPYKLIIRGDYRKYLQKFQRNRILLKEYAIRLASLDALIDSGITAFSQNKPETGNVMPNGDNPVAEYGKYIRDKGHFRLFKEKLDQSLAELGGNSRVFLEATNSSPEFIALERILDLCNDNEIRLILFVHPYHRSLMNVIYKSDRAREYQLWMEQLIRVVSGSSTTQLWDFSGNSLYTDETVPIFGDRKTNMRWYWEPGHYKNSLGDIIINRIFQHRTNAGRLLYGDAKLTK